MAMTCPTKIEILATSILQKLPGVGAWQRKFLTHLFVLWLSIRGRYNFAHLSRYGKYTESTYRNNFSKNFDFLTFNQELVERHLSSDRILAFDPSFLPKSGKHTDGVGKYWSGCAGQVKPGMEMSGLAAVDLVDKTAMHLMAVQTVLKDENETLLDYYLSIILNRKNQLLTISKYLVADAYFSKKPFVDQLVNEGFEFVSRLRTDTHLRYIYTGPKEERRGAPRQFTARVKVKELDKKVFTQCAAAEDNSWVAYSAIVNVKAWKRSASVVIVHDLSGEGEITGHRIYVSTDLSVKGEKTLHMYQSRYQQEFLYRDAKQELGLEHSQAYSWQKIDFHINMALTAGSLAKAAHHLDCPDKRREPFSIADIKTMYVNEYQARRIISMFRIDPDSTLIKKMWPIIRKLGLRRA